MQVYESLLNLLGIIVKRSWEIKDMGVNDPGKRNRKNRMHRLNFKIFKIYNNKIMTLIILITIRLNKI